jgi:hypothetical protein
LAAAVLKMIRQGNAYPVEGRSKMFRGSYPDITLLNEKLKLVIVVEHQSVYASGLPTKREADAAARLGANASAVEAEKRRRVVVLEAPKRKKDEKTGVYNKRVAKGVKARYRDRLRQLREP